MMQLTNTHNTIQALYTLEGTVLENVERIKYLDVTITSDLKWNSHNIRNVCTKASRTKEEAAYKRLEAQFGILAVMV